MSGFSRIIHYFVCLLLCVCMINAPVMAEGKPLLSEEIGAVIETQGIAAARQRFAEIYPAREDEYDIDVQGMMNLGSGFIQSGKTSTVLWASMATPRTLAEPAPFSLRFPATATW